MGIGLSGITSGLDTDQIIEAMVATKTAKKESLTKKQTILQWKQDAWKDMNSKIYNFYTKTLSDMRLASSYTKKSVSVSNPSVATVTANNGSVNGTQTLAVTQLAKAGYLTGARVSAGGEKVSASTKLADLGINDSSSINITVAGEEKVVNLSKDMTVSDLVSQLRKTGVSANFDATNQRFFISAKESGKDKDFSITSADGNGVDALKKLGLYTGATASDISQYRKWAEYDDARFTTKLMTDLKAAAKSAGLENVDSYSDADSLTAALTSAANAKKSANAMLETDIATQKANQTSYRNQREYAVLLADDANGTQLTEDYKQKASADRDAAQAKLDGGVDESGNALTEDAKKELQNQIDAAQAKLDAAAAVDAKGLDAEGAGTLIGELDAQITASSEDLASLTEELNANKTAISAYESAAGMKAQYEAKRTESKAYVEAYDKQDAIVKAAELAGQSVSDYVNTLSAAEQADYQNAVAKIGDITASSNTDGNGAVRIEGQNAVIYLNGAKFENTDNTITVNGLSITAQELTGTELDANGNEVPKTVSITTKTDAQGVYDMVKNFLKGYNELINEMDKLYNADYNKSYEPLTDEEKEALTDKEVEKYEQKIKDSLLRRDGTLGDVSQMMKRIMAGGTVVDGKQSYLSDLGISTLGYLYAAKNERGAYHIDGDKDDTATSGSADKLMAAILEDPDKVTNIITGIATKLYDGLSDKMKSTNMSSVYTVYNDKQMKDEYNSYSKKIKEQEEKISWWEDYYRSKFTAMEKMLASLNQQQSSLGGMLGN